MASMRTDVGIPRGTRLQLVQRDVTADGIISWRIITAGNGIAPGNTRFRGTYLELASNGSVDRITQYDEHEQFLEILPNI